MPFVNKEEFTGEGGDKGACSKQAKLKGLLPQAACIGGEVVHLQDVPYMREQWSMGYEETGLQTRGDCSTDCPSHVAAGGIHSDGPQDSHEQHDGWMARIKGLKEYQCGVRGEQ